MHLSTPLRGLKACFSFVCTSYALCKTGISYPVRTCVARGFPLSNCVFCLDLSIHGSKILKQLKDAFYSLRKVYSKMFELLFEGHSADSAIYDIWELQIQSVLISYYSSPTPPL